jgi:hypothetical protein
MRPTLLAMARWSLLASVLFVVACGGGGGGGGGPTAPAAVPQVAGLWVGQWATSGLVLQPTLNLTQSGSTLGGTFTLFSSTFAINGSVTPSLQLSWSAVGGGCGSLGGTGAVDALSATRISGNIDLNTTGCANPDRFVGSVIWRRAGTSVSVSTKGRLSDLVRAMKRDGTE